MKASLTIAIGALALASLPVLPAAAADARGAALAGAVTGSVGGTPRHDPPRSASREPARVYASGCFWTVKDPVWDETRGAWVQPRARDCDGR